jgi:hypothetical protein
LYPPEFREWYGESILSFHREHLADAKRNGESRGRVWRRTILDLLSAAALEWMSVVSRRLAPATTYAPPRLSAEDRMSIIVQEVVQSVRSLRRSVGFSVAAVVTLALGISSTTAIFSVVNSVLLAPLPFPAADRIVVPESMNLSTGQTSYFSYADFMDLARQWGVRAGGGVPRRGHGSDRCG